MPTIHYRKTPRTLPEAFGVGAHLYVEPRYIATFKAICRAIAQAAHAVAPFLGAAVVGAVLYTAFVIGVTR